MPLSQQASFRQAQVELEDPLTRGSLLCRLHVPEPACCVMPRYSSAGNVIFPDIYRCSGGFGPGILQL